MFVFWGLGAWEIRIREGHDLVCAGRPRQKSVAFFEHLTVEALNFLDFRFRVNDFLRDLILKC